jgi:hypothetical protein
MSEGLQVSVEIGKAVDNAIEGLRWCRQHMQDRGVTLRLRELEQTLGALALALDYEMDGQAGKVQAALERAGVRNRQFIQTYHDMQQLYDH